MSHGPAEPTGEVDPGDEPDDLTLTMPRVVPEEPRPVPSAPTAVPNAPTAVPNAPTAVPDGPVEVPGDWADDGLAGADGSRGQFTSGMAAGLAAVPYLRTAIRRRARLCGVCALLGLVLGFGAFKARPPTAKAEQEIYVTQVPGVEPQDAVLTDVALLQTRSLAELTLHRLGLTENVNKFMSSFIGVSLTDRVLEIVVSAPTSSEAMQRANAITSTFLQYRASIIATQRQATISKLNAELQYDDQQVAKFSNVIYQEETRAPSTQRTDKLAQLRGDLATAQAAVTTMAETVSSYEVGSEAGNAQEVAGSYPLYPAAALPPSKYRKAAVYAVGGLVAGLLLGMVIAVAAALMTDRLRRRDDVALAVGAPVRLSVGLVRVRGSGLPGRRKVTLPRALKAIGGIEVQRIAAQLWAAVPDRSDGAAALAVVVMDDPYSAVLPALSLALSCARAGGEVIIADLTDGTVVGQLLGFADPGVRILMVDGWQITLAVPDTCDLAPVGPLPQPADTLAAQLTGTATAGRAIAARVRSGRVVLGHGSAVQSAADYQLAAAYESADLLLTVATLDPAFGAEHLTTWAKDAVVIVTAGQSTATKIHSISEMTRLAGTDIRCAILVGADKSDESVGLGPADDWGGFAATAAEPAGGAPEHGDALPEPGQPDESRT